MIRVLLAEDQAMVLGALSALLDIESDLEVVAQARSGTEALDSYCVNLNKNAASGKVDPLIGREQEVDRTIQIQEQRF